MAREAGEQARLAGARTADDRHHLPAWYPPRQIPEQPAVIALESDAVEGQVG
jgi:hypothetical protein